MRDLRTKLKLESTINAMIKKLLYFALACGMLAGCNKGIDEPSVIEVGSDAEMRTATIKLSVKGQHKTKALAIGALDEDAVDRIDVYEFDCGSQGYWDILPNHIVLTDAQLTAGEFNLYNPTNSRRAYLLYANLPEAVAEKLANTRGNQFYNLRLRTMDLYDGTGGIPMGGTAYVIYSQNQTVEVSLERFFYRVDVGEIVADFDDSSLMSKDVFVKNVALINTANVIMMGGDYLSYLRHDTIGSAIFGPQMTTTEDKPFFGGLETVRIGYRVEDNTSYSCWIPSTNTTSSTTSMMNKNKYSAAGVLNITATDTWLTNTVHSYNIASGEGRICSSTNPSLSHTLTVNKSLYAMKGCTNFGSYPILSTSNDQNGFPKLVVELSINGKSYFYPIQMYCPMHNVAYEISRITLKSLGSAYSNFYEIKVAAEVEMSVADWDETEINNINVGYTDDTGTAIY